MNKLLCAAALCTSLSPFAALASPAHATPRESSIETTECPFQFSKEMAATPAAQGIECGTLHVPENRANARNTRMIKVRYAVFRANGPKTEYRQDALLFISGGPGTSVFYFPENLALAPFRRNRDVIAIDQRGNMSSDPVLNCTPAMQEGDLASVKSCAASLKARNIDLEGYDTTQSVADLIDFHRLLGRPPWNVVGVSYAGYWARAYAAQAPNDIRTIIFDSPMLPANTLYNAARTSRNNFSKLFALCTSDPDCQKRYPDLEKKYVSALRELKKHPAEIDGLRLSASDFAEIVYTQTYETETLKMIPRTIDLAFRKDYHGLADYGKWAAQNKRFRERGRQMGTASGPVYVSVLCRDEPTTKKTQTSYSAGPWPKDIESLSRYESWNLKHQCALWPTRKKSVEFPPLTHPALFVTGELDPITPKDAAIVENDKTFTVDFPRRSHGILLAPTECVFGIIEQFINDPSKKPDDRCAAAMPSIQFD